MIDDGIHSIAKKSQAEAEGSDKRVKKGRIVAAAAAVVTAISLFSACTLAYWNATGESKNVLTMSSYQAEIVEQYEIPSHVDPGSSVSKVVNVKNTGTVDMIVRVKIQKAFGTRDASGKLHPDAGLNPELIQLELNETCWKYLDGYWYYTGILGAGQTTKEPLLSGYTVSDEVTNDYKGKDAQIVVTMESVQAEGGALSMWGIAEKQLGISYPAARKGSATKVHYLGRKKGFTFSQKNTDLFAGFKNLLPGCSRTQKIVLDNSSDEEVGLFLYAQPAQQKQMSAKQRMLVEKLLSSYAQIQIRCGDKTLYSGPVDGNLNGSGQTMKEAISLGTFQKGEKKTLKVSLSLSPEMDNQFLSLTGKVQWVFEARGEESPKGTVKSSAIVPKTGDDTPLLQTAAILLISAGLFMAALRLKKAWDPERSSK